jgi:exodeoxyribonuclease VII large subunit
MKVIALGRVSVFPRDGQYQLYCSELSPDGVGELHIAFEQLRDRLHKEGLFDRERKRPLPMYPERIAVITSSAGAAVRDIIRVLGKRYPCAKVIILPVRVQGAEAPPEIVGAIKYANRYKVADLIITGRGGGSIEDLWAFNDERVARAIFDSEIPVISAVGHEPDVTIADYVADLRAATPSNAAELAVPDASEIREALLGMKIRSVQALKRSLSQRRDRLTTLSEKRVMKSPLNYIEDRRMLLDHAQKHFISAVLRSISQKKERFVHLAASMDAMSPLKVLGRGYSLAQKTDGSVIKSAADVQCGEAITLRLSSGALNCEVKERLE